MNYINKTPHAVHIIQDDKAFVIEPSGKEARLLEKILDVTSTPLNDTEEMVYISMVEYGQVVNLPEPQEDTLYIVSLPVALAKTDRDDLVFPYPLIRNEEGRVIGSGGFGKAV